MLKVPRPARRNEEMPHGKIFVRRVVQPEALLGLPPLARSVGTRKRQPRPRGDLLQRQVNGCRFALGGHKGGRVLPKRSDPVEDIVLDPPLSGGGNTPQKFNAFPEEHRLGRTELPLGRLGPDEDWLDIGWEESAIQGPVNENPLPVGNNQVVPSWAHPGAQRPSSLQHLGECLSEALASHNERTVEIKKSHTAPMALSQGQSISSAKVSEESRALQSLVVNCVPTETVPEGWKLVEIAR
jgi:hypothetical protein